MCNKVKKVKRALHSFFLMLLATSLIACGGGGSSDGSSGGGPVINKPNSSSLAASSIEDQSSSAPAMSSTFSFQSSSSSSISLSSARSSELAYTRSSRNNSSQSDSSSSAIPISLYRLSETGITVTWDDTNTGAIAHYLVKRDNDLIAMVEYPALAFADRGLPPASTHTYSITAIDDRGNNLGDSDSLTVQTLGLAYSSVASSYASSQSSNIAVSSNSAKSSSSTHSSVWSSLPSSSSVSTSKPAFSSSSSSSKPASSSSSSKPASSSAPNKGGQAITITWDHPKQRENGTYLELDEIAGYEIRYRKPTDTRYTYIVINSNKVREYTTSIPAQGTEFEIAVFDTGGLYSRFNKVNP